MVGTLIHGNNNSIHASSSGLEAAGQRDQVHS